MELPQAPKLAHPQMQKGSQAGLEGVDIALLSKTVSELNRRVRTVEEQLTASRQRLDIVDDSVHDTITSVTRDVSEIKTQISEINSALTDFRTTLQQIVKQLSVFARKNDLTALEKYVDLLDPTQYLGKKEIVNLIREHMNMPPMEEEEEAEDTVEEEGEQ